MRSAHRLVAATLALGVGCSSTSEPPDGPTSVPVLDENRRVPALACSRGAAIAAYGSSPNASIRTVTCVIAGWMYCDPAAPITSRTCPPSRITVGDIVEFAYRFTPRVRASKFDPAEFRKKPSVYTPEPNSTPTVVVAATAFPAASTTERCEV